MRDANEITKYFYTINSKLIERKNELIVRYPYLNKYGYHIGIFREELLKETLVDCIKSEGIIKLNDIIISSGFIIDNNKNISKQIDILVFKKGLNPYDYYSYGMFSIVHIDNVIAAIEIKSKLTKNQLESKDGAFNNITSIRNLSSDKNNHIFTAIIGYEGVKDWNCYKEYLKEYYKEIFDLIIKEFVIFHQSFYNREDLATKKFTPDMIVTLDGILILFGVKADLENLVNRPAAFLSKPLIMKYTSFQYFYFELIISIINSTSQNIS